MVYILVIDDDKSFLDMLVQTIKHEGYEVDYADNAEVGLQMLMERQYDLLITDILMPHKDGVELLIDIRNKGLNLPIIAISGGGVSLSKKYSLNIAQNFGCTATLAKPFTRHELITVITEALQHS